ncbi:MAG TPA: AraC family transcriptional regulator [Polyangiaceae bacterium]
MPCTIRREGGTDAGFELALPSVPAALVPFVESCVGYHEWSQRTVERLELPSGRAVLIFELGPPIAVGASGEPVRRYRAGFFAAIGEEPALTTFDGAQAGIQVNLTPRGAHALLGRDTPDFAGVVAEVGVLPFAEPVCEALASAASWEARIALVLRALAHRFASARDQSNVVRWAIERIDRSQGAIRIDALSSELGYSRKYLHAKFLDEVGIAPKRYAALRRFNQVVERLRAGNVESLARLAVETGYSDQAHLAREVRRFSGVSSTSLAVSVRDPIALAVRELGL